MKYILHLIKAFIDTLKDPDLLSSRPHHGEDEGWTCSHCQIRHTSDMEIGHKEWDQDFLSEEILLCVQCCDDINYQGASESEKDTKSEDKHCVDCGDYIMPLDWCGCTDPNDANYKGYSCPKCSKTRMKCECEELQND